MIALIFFCLFKFQALTYLSIYKLQRHVPVDNEILAKAINRMTLH